MRKRIVASIKFTRYLFICRTSSGNKYYVKASQSKDWNEQKYNHSHKYKSILNLRIIKYSRVCSKEIYHLKLIAASHKIAIINLGKKDTPQ